VDIASILTNHEFVEKTILDVMTYDFLTLHLTHRRWSKFFSIYAFGVDFWWYSKWDTYWQL